MNESSTHSNSFVNYLKKSSAHWYWIILSLMIMAALFVLGIPTDQYPLVIIRYIFGLMLILVLPGYCLLKMLFPHQILTPFERTILSVGLSLALTPTVTLLLNYSAVGISVNSIIVSIIILNIIFATVGIVRQSFLLIGKKDND